MYETKCTQTTEGCIRGSFFLELVLALECPCATQVLQD
jgi:hypothetical protein